jgi:hypothetical protein
MFLHLLRDIQNLESYTGNGNADGAFAFTGFRPAFVLIKKYNASGDSWLLMGCKRLGYNEKN